MDDFWEKGSEYLVQFLVFAFFVGRAIYKLMAPNETRQEFEQAANLLGLNYHKPGLRKTTRAEGLYMGQEVEALLTGDTILEIKAIVPNPQSLKFNLKRSYGLKDAIPFLKKRQSVDEGYGFEKAISLNSKGNPLTSSIFLEPDIRGHALGLVEITIEYKLNLKKDKLNLKLVLKEGSSISVALNRGLEFIRKISERLR